MKRSEAEKKFLIIYSLLSLAFLLAGITAPNILLVLFGTIPELIVSWTVFIRQPLDEKFRAVLLSVMCLITLTCFGVMVISMDVVIPILAVVLFMIGLFNIPEILWIWVADAMLLFLYHLLVGKTYVLDSWNNWLIVIHQLICTLLLLYLEDMLIRKNAEKNNQLKETIESLKASERSKDEFMAGVSHEFRTPLNAICGMGELILHSDASEEVKKSADRILTAGQSLQDFVSDVFDYVELCSNNMQLKEEEYHFASMLNDIVNIANIQTEEKNLEIIIDCDAAIPHAMIGDSEKMRKVITSFLSNAVRHTEKGYILLTASARKESYGVNLCIVIRDTGSGMTKDDIKKMFTDIYVAGACQNGKCRSVGLDLAVSQKLVEMMNGLISVTSEPGAGTEVRIVIPQKVADARPMVELADREYFDVMGYINLDKFDIEGMRSTYVRWIENVGKMLGIHIELNTGLNECKRKVENRGCTHLFITMYEYRQDPGYFKSLTERIQVIVVLERRETDYPGNEFIIVYKPFTIMSVVAALTGHSQKRKVLLHDNTEESFIAPDAKLLVVDDNVINLKVMEGLLRRYQIVPYTATSGAAALQMMEKIRFDLVFMDYMMPGMDGAETMERIRAMEGEYYRKVPVVCVTANTVSGAREQLLQTGFNEFISKPVEVRQLEKILKSYLHVEIYEPEKELEKEPETGTTGEAEISRIDRRMGETYCGSKEDYQEILKIFCDYGAEKKREIQNLYEKHDWKGYAIEIHALKSTSLGIGAVRLSELAKRLELAAKEEKEEMIFAEHDAAMEEYRMVLEEIEKDLE